MRKKTKKIAAKKPLTAKSSKKRLLEEIKKMNNDKLAVPLSKRFSNLKKGNGLSKKKSMVEHPLDYIFNRENEDPKAQSVNMKRTSTSVPYHLQSNPEMNTKEAMQKRKALKSNPKLRKCILQFCEAVYQGFKLNGQIDEEEYVRVHLLITQQLHGKNSIGVEEMEKLAHQDWQKDANGKDFMTEKELYDAIFELADLWCKTISAKEYGLFLDSLRVKIKYQDAYNPRAYSILF